MSIRPIRRRAVAVLVAASCASLLSFACGRNAADAEAAPAAAAPSALAPAAATEPAAAGAPGAPAAPGAAAAAEPVLAPEQIPAIVARIEGREVTREDLIARAQEARGALAERGVQAPPATRSFYRSVLDDLIGNALLYAELSAQGRAAAPADVDQQVAAVRAQFKTDAEFDQALAGRGFDRDRLRREVTESLTVQKWVRETVMPSIQVSEGEAKEFYDQNQARMVEPERLRARHLLVSVDPQATAEQKAEKRRRVDELRVRIAGGADFAQVAKEASDDPITGPRGGELEWLVRGRAVPAFEKAAFELPPGRLSEVVETRFGFHLIEVHEKKPETRIEFVQARERIEQLLKQRKLEQAVRSKLNDLGAKAKVEILI
jgi:peptidyl-prolyl cis-trans isomerase C